MASFKGTAKERFAAIADLSTPEECWIWDNCPDRKRYGRLKFGDVVDYAHRVSWIIHRGEIPKGMHVLHHCDVPACVNPSHLFIGTPLDNMRDRDKKGRNYRGARLWSCKLAESDVSKIRELVSYGVSQSDVARSYRISQPLVSRMVHRIIWKHIP